MRRRSNTLGFKYRNALDLMTMANNKTPKGEKSGFLSAILYLMPHDSGGGKNLCPFSTEECRSMCLAGAGMSALPRQMGAKQRRTDLWANRPTEFLRRLDADLRKLVELAEREGLRAAARLNGTSDIAWERTIDLQHYPIQFYDYTKIPLEHRTRGLSNPNNYHLTFSVGSGQELMRGVEYLREGFSIAVVVPEDVKDRLVGSSVDLGGVIARYVDGDEHDARFLDPTSSIILLKPKGHLRSDLIRPSIHSELLALARRAA